MSEKEFEGYPIHRQVDSEGRLLTAWKPTTTQFRKLVAFINGPVSGALTTHICPACEHPYVLHDVGEAESFVCYNGCGEKWSLAEAHNLAEARLQDAIDDIFG
jgi:hypothetical protein